MYQFVVDFIGEVPEHFAFVYTLVTVIISITVFGSFISLFYWVLRFIRGVVR